MENIRYQASWIKFMAWRDVEIDQRVWKDIKPFRKQTKNTFRGNFQTQKYYGKSMSSTGCYQYRCDIISGIEEKLNSK